MIATKRIRLTIYAFAVILMAFSFYSCEKYSDCTLPLAGLYEAQIVGVSGPFTMGVSINHGRKISIDAQWLLDKWYVADANTTGCADYNSVDYGKVTITISEQKMDDGKRISGKGFYYDFVMQIDYTITEGSNKYHYTLIASKK
jgi:hypothetical protein